jgi:hypothetical protein
VQCVCEHLIGEIGFEVEQVVAPLEPLAVLAGGVPQEAETPDQAAGGGELPRVEGATK